MKNRRVLFPGLVGCVVTVLLALLPWTAGTENPEQRCGLFGEVSGFEVLAPGLILIAVCELVSALLMLGQRGKLALAASSVAVIVALVCVVITPLGMCMWDGQDAAGRWIGGMEQSQPSVGMMVIPLFAGLVLLDTAILVFRSNRVPRSDTVFQSAKATQRKDS